MRDYTAPGNTYRKPKCILPHEHVNVSKYLDVDGTDRAELMEIYGHYAYLIDLHIAQIRPENLQEKSYVPSKYAQVTPNEDTEFDLDNMYFEYYHRWHTIPRTWRSQSQEIDFIKNKEEKCFRFDPSGEVLEREWKEGQKFPHVASRLGYPILAEEPIDRILSIERAPAHPGYQHQPFVQTPGYDPDPTLSFEAGEVIYENRNILEWVRFWKVLTAITFGVTPGFYVFEIYAADGAPSIDWMAENFSWHKVPKQFQDGSGWGLEEIRYCDDHEYMNVHYGAKRMFARPINTAYLAQLMVLLSYTNMDYVSKMRYNKDKDLVFVHKPDGFWNEREYCHEVHHLEQTVPFAISAIENMGSQKKDGIMTIYDMNMHDELKFYNDDKYWNMEVKDEFMALTNNLQVGNFNDKRDGSIFRNHAIADEEEAVSVSN